MKDGPAGLEFRFRMETVELGCDRHGDMVTSLVAMEDETPSERSPEAELRFRVGCQLPPNQALSLKKVNEMLGKAWGSRSGEVFERASAPHRPARRWRRVAKPSRPFPHVG